ncbi:MAG: F0F1 ATP synthase subunit A [Clostridiales Family XIII bacterium]|nr:F0F1 ATP synthase subunit A [Clostridiales Family XIII bacterium]
MEMNLGPRVIFLFPNGFYITETVVWAVIVAICMILWAVLSTRRMEKVPRGVQIVNELIVETVYNFVKNTMGPHCKAFAPYIGTLFFFLLINNALGMLPGADGKPSRASTADMNFTFAMGVLVFFLIQINSIRSKGGLGYIKHFAEPLPFMVPLKILEEITFPISLSFRIFGNILAGVIIMDLFFHLMHFVSESLLGAFGERVPVFQAVVPLFPNAFFDMFEPFLQAFVFCMLTMSFISRGITVHGEHE